MYPSKVIPFIPGKCAYTAGNHLNQPTASQQQTPPPLLPPPALSNLFLSSLHHLSYQPLYKSSLFSLPSCFFLVYQPSYLFVYLVSFLFCFVFYFVERTILLILLLISTIKCYKIVHFIVQMYNSTFVHLYVCFFFYSYLSAYLIVFSCIFYFLS